MKQIGVIELRQHLDDILLSWSRIRMAFEGLIPHFLHGAIRPQAGNKVVAFRP